MPLPSDSTLSHLKFRHFLLIDRLMQEGTLRKVATFMNISQPAATAMLSEIEKLIGLTLFTRSRQGVAPTAAAVALMPRIRVMLNEFDEFGALIRRLSAGSEESLRVGLVQHVFSGVLARAVEQFRQDGGCLIRSREGTSKDLLAALVDGELDCVVGRLSHDMDQSDALLSQVSFTNLYEDNICVACGPMHPGARRRKLDFSWLSQCEWVLQRPTSTVRRALVEAFMRHGLKLPEPVVETATFEQNLAIVATSSTLLTVAPKSTALAYQSLGLVRLPAIELNVHPMSVAFVTRTTARSHAQLEKLRQALIHVTRDEVKHGRIHAASLPPR